MDLVARLKLDDQFSFPLKRITSHFSRMQSVTERTSSSVRNFGSSVAGLASAIGITAALASSFNMVKNSISSAFSRIDTMEAFERTMTVLTGSAEKTAAALEATREAVTGTAYGLDVAAKGVQDFVTRGMQIEKATKTMAAWGDAVAFYGDGSNEQLSTVSDALAKMYSSGKVGMDQMNRLYDVGIDGVGMYAKAVKRDASVVQKELSKGKIPASEFIDVVTKAMMEGTNGVQKIAGAAKEAGASWGASFDNMKAAVTRGVVDIIQEIDRLLVDNGLPDMRTMIANFGKSFETQLKRAAKAIEPMVRAIKRLYDFIQPAVPVIKAFGISVGIALVSVTAASKIIGLLAAGVAFLASPVGLAIAAVTGLVLGFQAAYKHSDTFRAKIDGLLKSTGRIKDVIDTLKEVIMALWYDTGEVGDLFEKFGLSPEEADRAGALVTGIYNAIKEFVSGVKTSVSEFVTFLGAKWTELQPGIAAMVSAFTSAKDFVVGVFTTLWGVIQPILGAIGSALHIVAGIASLAFNNIIAPAIEFVMSLFSAMWKLVGPILELLGAAFELTFGLLKIAWDAILKPFADWLTSVFATSFEAAKTHVEGISDAFGWLGDKVSGAVDWFRKITDAVKNFKVPDWLSRLGGGGTVRFEAAEASPDGSHYSGLTRVPYDGYLARLHRGERVLTRQEADTMDARYSYDDLMGGGDTYNTYNSVINSQTTTQAGGSGRSPLTIEKLADQIIVREDADIDRIEDALYRRWSAAQEAGA